MTNSTFIVRIKRIIPQKVWNFLKIIYLYFSNFYYTIYYEFVQWRYKKIIRQIQKKPKIKVAFFLIHEAVWKHEGLYKLMELDKRFDPIIIVCPYVVHGKERMLKDMDQAYNFFHERGYQVIKTLDNATDEWLDVKKRIQPDIVFFTNPHKLTKDKYSITNFRRTLTCYVPYTFQTTYHYQQNYNGYFHNILWKAYYPTPMHYNMAVKYALNKGRNVIVTGYPVIDIFLNSNSSGKINERLKFKKYIIWAPHHTIEGAGMDLNFSNFLRYHDFMIKLAEEFKDNVYITFKPHPLLRTKLNYPNIWGKEKTDAYYNFWKENDFCGFNDGNYTLLFEQSDAMIHDCDSFMGEYLSLNKPVLYTRRDDFVKDRMNEFGRSANDMHYQAGNKGEILEFINEVVIKGVDSMKNKRTKWIKDFLTPPNTGIASMNIYFDLKKSLEIN